MRSEARDACIRACIQVTTETNEGNTPTRGGPDEVILRMLNAQPRSAARDDLIRMITEDMRNL
jgi:hypothetical protein